MAVNPQKGDTIRITYEGVLNVSPSGSSDEGVLYSFDGQSAYLTGAQVEILSRPEDLADDPVGTVRDNRGGDPFVKAGPDTWVLYEDTLTVWTDERVGRFSGLRPIIGAVPGTPAAKSAEFVGRVYLDHYGLELHEQKPGLFRYRSNRGYWGIRECEFERFYPPWSLVPGRVADKAPE